MSKRVLYLEPDDEMATELQNALVARGVEVEITADGTTAFDKITATSPDVFLLAAELPNNQSGFAICNRIKKSNEWRHLPVVLLSSKAKAVEDHKQLKWRADGYLLRPASSSVILAALEPYAGPYKQTEDTGSIALDDSELSIVEELSMDEEPGGDPEEEIELVDMVSGLKSESAVPAARRKSSNTIGVAKSRGADGSQADKLPEAQDAAPPAEAHEEAPEPASAAEPSAPAPSRSSTNAGLSGGHRREPTPAPRKEPSVATAVPSPPTAARRTGFFGATGGASQNRDVLELRESLNRKDREILDLQSALDRKDRDILDQKSKIRDAERKVRELEDKALDLEKASVDADERYVTSDEERVQEIERLKTKITRDLAERESLERHKLQLATEEKAAAVAEAEEKLRSQMKQVEADAERRIGEARGNAQNEIDKARRESKGELDSARAQTRAEIEAARMQAKQEVDGVRAEAQIELEAARAESKKELDAAALQHARELAALADRTRAAEDLEHKARAAREEAVQAAQDAHDEISTLRRDVASRDETITAREDEIAGFKRKIENLENDVTFRKAEVATRDNEVASLKQQIESQYKQLAEKQDLIDALESDNKALRARGLELENEVARQQDDVVRAYQRLKADDQHAEQVKRALAIVMALMEKRSQ